MHMADDTPRPYNSVEIQSAITAAQDRAATVPLDNYDAVTVSEDTRLLFAPSENDSAVDILPFKRSSMILDFVAQPVVDTTDEVTPKPSLDIPMFEFSDFSADLTLSPTSSTTPSLSSDPPRPDSPSSTSSAVPSTGASATTPERAPKELPSTQLSPVKAATLMRSSWPLIKYVGRGTPIDRTRRSQWGGSIDYDNVGEDGVLYSTTVRSSSFESAAQSSTRSVSPEWNLVSVTSSQRSQNLPPMQLMIQEEGEARGPPTDHLGISDRLEAKPKEWSDFMQGLLESTAAASASSEMDLSQLQASTSSLAIEETPTGADSEGTSSGEQDAGDTTETPTARPSEEGIDDELKMDLGSNTVLDLSLSVGPNTNHIPVPEYASGRMSPSVYSTAPPTPCASPPASSISRHSSCSSSSSASSAMSRYSHRPGPPWWRKFLSRVEQLRKLRRVLRSLKH
ncbi:hypothetical protein EYR40_007535 [Pleurotus pulmonarius]|nr:hypothetical protein EYR38_008167 [Pleurotus pulmonarius]KAF4597085.1 hypothetical protein EYR40_007535 [Pleurotus pulmonarius]